MSQADKDYEKGLSGIGSGSGRAYLNGVIDRERQRKEYKESQKPRQANPTPPIPSGHSISTHENSAARVETPKALTASQDSLGLMAKNGAWLFAVLFAGYTILKGNAWSWPALLGGALGFAVIGAFAGAMLYVALKLLEFAIKIVFGLFVIGIALHFLGIVNIWTILEHILRALGIQ